MKKSPLTLLSFLSIKCVLVCIILAPLIAACTTPIKAAEVITVQGQVGPSISQLHTTLTADKSELHQGELVTYTLKYSTDSVSAYPMTLTATWDLAHPTGDPDTTLDVLEYQQGTAGSAIGGAAPIVDTLQRKITWNIPSFSSADGTQQLSFTLKTSAGISAATPPLLVQTSSFMSVGATTGVSSTVSHTLTYNAPPSPTSTSPAPQSPTPSSTATLENQATQKKMFKISLLRLRSLTHQSAMYQVQLESPSKVRVVYGTAPTALNQVLAYPQETSVHTVTFKDLSPRTQYYFKVLPLEGSPNEQQLSSMNTFTTAQQPATVRSSSLQAIVLSQEGKIVSTFFNPKNTLMQTDQDVKVVGLTGFSLDMSIKFDTPDRSVKGQSYLLDPNPVFGVASEHPHILTESRSELQQESSSIVNTEFILPQKTGAYVATIQLHDEYGNITEQPVAEVCLVSPLKVINSSTKDPVPAAKVELFKMNDQTQLYEAVPLSKLTLLKYRRSRPNGEVIFVPYRGKYQANIHHIDYESTTVEFEINPEQSENLPTVEMTPKPFNVFFFIWKHIVIWMEKLEHMFDKDEYWTAYI
jgi:hypothetical protein